MEKAGGSSQVKPIKAQGRGGGRSPGQAGHLQEHGHPAGVVVGPGGAGHGVEVGPQDVVAAGVLVAGDDIAHLFFHVGKALAPGRITHGRKVLRDVILSRFKIPGAADGPVPQGDAQMVQMIPQVGLDVFSIHGVSPARLRRASQDDCRQQINQYAWCYQ